MQLKSLHLQSFLIHEDKKVDFTEDLNILRGKNERGKSGLVEGFGYLLSGATALEKTVEDTVNYNAKSEAAMKVTGVFTHKGETFTAKRGPSGAEVKREGTVVCTGHKPVTQYLEKLLNLPAGRAHHILLANQNEIRGVLALGPTAATEFIEKLADFSEIDQLIKKLVAELPNGKTDALESQVTLAEETLEAIIIPEVPNHVNTISELTQEVNTAQEKVADLNEKLTKQANEVTVAETEQTRLTMAKGRAGVGLQTAKDILAPLQGAELAIKDLKTAVKGQQTTLDGWSAYTTYTEVEALNKVIDEGDVWEGGLTSLEDEVREECRKQTTRSGVTEDGKYSLSYLRTR